MPPKISDRRKDQLYVMDKISYVYSMLIYKNFRDSNDELISYYLQETLRHDWNPSKESPELIEGGMKLYDIMMIGLTLLALSSGTETPVMPDVFEATTGEGVRITFGPENIIITPTEGPVVTLDNNNKKKPGGMFEVDKAQTEANRAVLRGIFNETDETILTMVQHGWQSADYSERRDTEGNIMPLKNGLLHTGVVISDPEFLEILQQQFDLLGAVSERICTLAFKPPIVVKPIPGKSDKHVRGPVKSDALVLKSEHDVEQQIYKDSFKVDGRKVAMTALCAALARSIPVLAKRLVPADKVDDNIQFKDHPPKPLTLPPPATSTVAEKKGMWKSATSLVYKRMGYKTDDKPPAEKPPAEKPPAEKPPAEKPTNNTDIGKKVDTRVYEVSIQFPRIPISIPELIEMIINNQYDNELALPEMPQLFIDFAMKELLDLIVVLHSPKDLYKDDFQEQIHDIAKKLSTALSRSKSILSGDATLKDWEEVTKLKGIQDQIALKQLQTDLTSQMEFLEFYHLKDKSLKDQSQRHWNEDMIQNYFGPAAYFTGSIKTALYNTFIEGMYGFLMPASIALGTLLALVAVRYRETIKIWVGGVPLLLTKIVYGASHFIFIRTIKGSIVCAYTGTKAQMARVYAMLISRTEKNPPPAAPAAAAPAAADPVVVHRSSPQDVNPLVAASAAASAPLEPKKKISDYFKKPPAAPSPQLAAPAAAAKPPSPPKLEVHKKSSPAAAAPPPPGLARKKSSPAAAAAAKPPSPPPLARKNSSPKAAAAAERPPSPPKLKDRKSSSPKGRRSPSPGSRKMSPPKNAPTPLDIAKTARELATTARELADAARAKSNALLKTAGSTKLAQLYAKREANEAEAEANKAELEADEAELAVISGGGGRTKRRRRANQRKTRKVRR